MTKPCEVFEDLVGGFGPDEGFGCGVGQFDVTVDGGFQLVDAAMDASADLFFGQGSEPALDEVNPGGPGWGEVDVEAGVTC